MFSLMAASSNNLHSNKSQTLKHFEWYSTSNHYLVLIWNVSASSIMAEVNGNTGNHRARVSNNAMKAVTM